MLRRSSFRTVEVIGKDLNSVTKRVGSIWMAGRGMIREGANLISTAEQNPRRVFPGIAECSGEDNRLGFLGHCVISTFSH